MNRKFKDKFGKKGHFNLDSEGIFPHLRHPSNEETTPKEIDETQRCQLNEILENKENLTHLKNEDFERIDEIGYGSAGIVFKVKYKPTNTILAQKIIRLLVKPTILTQIIRELGVLKKCHSNYIVSFFGAYQDQGELYMLMEYMDCGSLDKVCKVIRRIPEDILGKIVHDVIQGLNYLRTNQSVIHRDIKPSNILLNSNGEVKICDFGVSGTLVDSMAKTFVGTRSYMSPERLEGKKYTVRSDIWSLGVLMVELSIGRYPYPPIPIESLKRILDDQTGKLSESLSDDHEEIAIFELLDYIVNDEPPKLFEPHFSKIIIEFVSKCLVKDPAERADFDELLHHEYIIKNKNTDIKEWSKSLN